MQGFYRVIELSIVRLYIHVLLDKGIACLFMIVQVVEIKSTDSCGDVKVIWSIIFCREGLYVDEYK